MAQITTTTNPTPLQQPSTTLIDRNPQTGHLFVMVKASAANTYEVWRSTDGGTTWAVYASLVRTGVQEIGSIFITNVSWLHWCYRTNESSQDRIYWRRLNLNNSTWGPEVLTGNPGNGGTGGSVHTGLDLHVVVSLGQEFVAIAAGTQLGASHGVTLYGVRVSTSGTATYNNDGVFIGKRQWLHTGTGRITPSADIEHNGDGKSAGVPHLWVVWGRTNVYAVKLAWSWRWSGPTSASKVTPVPLTPAQDSIAGRWQGNRFCIALPDPAVTDRVLLHIRFPPNNGSTILQSPAHPAGVVRNCTLSYNAVNRDIRIYAVGTANPDLYFIDRVNATGTWTSWSTESTRDIIGTPPNQYSVRRGSSGNARHDVLDASGVTPFPITHTPQALSYAPNAPAWDTGAMGRNHGAAADVAAALLLDWTFSDPDPADTQSAYALSRQIGAGALQFWQASTSTWVGAEVKNIIGTSAVTLAAGWANATDAQYTYAAKVWDSADLASLYGPGFTVIPSAKVNPTITSPIESGTITTSEVDLQWTVAEQTAFRVRLVIFGNQLHDSGWIASTATSYTVPVTLADGFNYSTFLTTRNLEGLASNEVQVNFGVDFIEPAVASTVATPQPAPPHGVISVAITNPAPVGGQPAFVSQDLWRRPVKNPILNGNPTFEGDLSGWDAPTGGAAVRANDFAKFGAWSYKLTPDGVTAAPRVESIKLPATEGVSYHLDGWIRAATVNKPVALFFRWYTAAEVFISESVTYVAPLTAGTFLYRGPIATAPATTAKMTICAGLSTTPAVGDIIWVDELRVRATDTSDGVRVAAGLPAAAVYGDWGAVSGVDYEYRSIVAGANGTSSFGPWTG